MPSLLPRLLFERDGRQLGPRPAAEAEIGGNPPEPTYKGGAAFKLTEAFIGTSKRLGGYLLCILRVMSRADHQPVEVLLIRFYQLVERRAVAASCGLNERLLGGRI